MYSDNGVDVLQCFWSSLNNSMHAPSVNALAVLVSCALFQGCYDPVQTNCPIVFGTNGSIMVYMRPGTRRYSLYMQCDGGVYQEISEYSFMTCPVDSQKETLTDLIMSTCTITTSTTVEPTQTSTTSATYNSTASTTSSGSTTESFTTSSTISTEPSTTSVTTESTTTTTSTTTPTASTTITSSDSSDTTAQSPSVFSPSGV